MEALREESTIQELSGKYGVHPNQISKWKAQAIEGMADLFERLNKKSEEEKSTEEEKDRLLKTIGEQKVEIDFLKKSTNRYTGTNQPCRPGLQSIEYFTSMFFVGNKPWKRDKRIYYEKQSTGILL